MLKDSINVPFYWQKQPDPVNIFNLSALAIPLCVRYPWVIHVYVCIWRSSGLLTAILYIATFESSLVNNDYPCHYINLTILMNLWMCCH